MKYVPCRMTEKFEKCNTRKCSIYYDTLERKFLYLCKNLKYKDFNLSDEVIIKSKRYKVVNYSVNCGSNIELVEEEFLRKLELKSR